MARGGPRKAGGPSKKGSKAAVTLLTEPDQDELNIPPMPPTHDWLPPIPDEQRAGFNPLDPDPFYENKAGEVYPPWNPAVVRWWRDIWSSPMSSEFVNSDIHGLYIGCYLLHEALNPEYKLADRLASLKSFEATLKNYGLTPSARETLRWQIAQGTNAQRRTDAIRQESQGYQQQYVPPPASNPNHPAYKPMIDGVPRPVGHTPNSDNSLLDLYKRNS